MVHIEENNMGNMTAEQAVKFFHMVKESQGLTGLEFDITPISPSIYLGYKILLCESDLQYPWFTKMMILHEFAHHFAPQDTTHGTQFHREFGRLVVKYLAGEDREENEN